jgi:hypothetical protein
MAERINIRNEIYMGNIQSAIERINALHPQVSYLRFISCIDFLSSQ